MNQDSTNSKPIDSEHWLEEFLPNSFPSASDVLSPKVLKERPQFCVFWVLGFFFFSAWDSRDTRVPSKHLAATFEHATRLLPENSSLPHSEPLEETSLPASPMGWDLSYSRPFCSAFSKFRGADGEIT